MCTPSSGNVDRSFVYTKEIKGFSPVGAGEIARRSGHEFVIHAPVERPMPADSVCSAFTGRNRIPVYAQFRQHDRSFVCASGFKRFSPVRGGRITRPSDRSLLYAPYRKAQTYRKYVLSLHQGEPDSCVRAVEAAPTGVSCTPRDLRGSARFVRGESPME